MKILMINKFYYIKGGSETYFFGLKRMLEENGHEVIPFSMKDDKNFDSEYSEYFIENIDYTDKNILNKIKNAGKIIYNFEAVKKLRELIKAERPDIAHLHIFQHQISPSILKVLKDEGIPIVYTVHDLKPVCLNYKMLNENGICEKCLGEKYYNCLKNKCVKGSYLFSGVNTIEGYVHKVLKSYEYIDYYITPSNFYREMLIKSGIDKDKIEHIPNFIDSRDYVPNYEFEDYFIYVGRLSEEKGVETLIKAMEHVNESKLKIVGTGPMEKKLKDLVVERKIENVEFLGFKSGMELKNIVSKSKFMVIPSEWYENGPMSVLEAMAMGKAIIGANIGGIPEMIEENENGLLFKSGDISDINVKLNHILNSDECIKKFGKRSRGLIEKKYDSKVHYEKIINVYKKFYHKN